MANIPQAVPEASASLLVSRTQKLCESCSQISLPAIINAIPKLFLREDRGDPHDWCRGTQASLHWSTKMPLIFPNVKYSAPTCSLCGLINLLAGNNSYYAPLQLAALIPPLASTNYSPILDIPYGLFKDPQPQPEWHGIDSNGGRVNTMEPVIGTSGKIGERRDYIIDSPWQISIAADKGRKNLHHISGYLQHLYLLLSSNIVSRNRR